MHSYLINPKIYIIPLKKANTNIFIVTGDLHQGKTTFVQQVVELLDVHKSGVAGFFSLGEMLNGNRSGFVLHDISSATNITLCSEQFHESWKLFRRFFFNPDALAAGNRMLVAGANEEKRILVVDEIGPMELGKDGWYVGVSHMQKHFKGIQILVVRRKLIDEVVAFFQLNNPFIVDIEKHNPQEFVELLNLR